MGQVDMYSPMSVTLWIQRSCTGAQGIAAGFCDADLKLDQKECFRLTVEVGAVNALDNTVAEHPLFDAREHDRHQLVARTITHRRYASVAVL